MAISRFVDILGESILIVAVCQALLGLNWPTKRIWSVGNVLLIALSLYIGYTSLAPERLRHLNPDLTLCGFILLTLPLFAVGAVDYSVRRCKHDTLPRPSIGRNPMNWWHDPLQSLFITTCVMITASIGGALRRPAMGSVGFWMLVSYTCSVAGLLLGQVLVYRFYRAHIVARPIDVR